MFRVSGVDVFGQVNPLSDAEIQLENSVLQSVWRPSGLEILRV